VSEGEAVGLASRLTERDRRVARDCFEHRVLTTEQLRRLHFGGARTARNRLRLLYELRILDRFRPPWPYEAGSSPYHWVLDQAGSYVVAEQLGLEPKELRWRRDAAIALARSAKLSHQVAVNEFFTRLAEEARRTGGSLREWWGERRSLEALGGLAAPDGYGRLELPGERKLALLLELDRGTEDYQRLREKARRYTKALRRSELREPQPVVVVVAPSQARAAGARKALSGTAVPTAAIVWTPERKVLGALLDGIATARSTASEEHNEPPHEGPPPAPHD
jgi:hypothetical protein